MSTIQSGVVAIDKLSLWTQYCEFGLLFTRVDNTIESFSGLTNAFYKVVLNWVIIEGLAKKVQTSFEADQCGPMMIAVGNMF